MLYPPFYNCKSLLSWVPTFSGFYTCISSSYSTWVSSSPPPPSSSYHFNTFSSVKSIFHYHFLPLLFFSLSNTQTHSHTLSLLSDFHGLEYWGKIGSESADILKFSLMVVVCLQIHKFNFIIRKHALYECCSKYVSLWFMFVSEMKW